MEIAHDTKKKKNRFPSKSEVMATVIRVLPLFGFKGGTVNLVNVLLNFTQKQDWQAKKPVVWACNNTLADLAGFFSESGARKALYRLRAEGLIAYDDRPGYHRCGKRDKDGNIIEASGIDLSPLATRHQEFVDKIRQCEFDRLEKKRLLRKRRMLVYEITSMLQAAIDEKLAGSWQQIFARLETLAEAPSSSLQKLEAIVADLEALDEEISDVIITQRNIKNNVKRDTPLSRTGHPYISTNTNLSKNVICNVSPNKPFLKKKLWKKKKCGCQKHPLTVMQISGLKMMINV